MTDDGLGLSPPVTASQYVIGAELWIGNAMDADALVARVKAEQGLRDQLHVSEVDRSRLRDLAARRVEQLRQPQTEDPATAEITAPKPRKSRR